MKRGNDMNKKILWITETAVMLALLITLQTITKPLGQIVTGSCVNAILALTTLVAGLYSGLTVAVVSPVMAFLLGIAPMPLTVLPIMVGNACYVAVLFFIYNAKPLSKPFWTQPLALVAAATVKFGVLYLLVVRVICTFVANAPKALPAMFTWPQLITALVGGAVALLIAPMLRKALQK